MRTLRVGDVIQYGPHACRVMRVNDCSAVIGVPQPERTIRTLAGKVVTILPHAKWVRISPQSEVPILNR